MTDTLQLERPEVAEPTGRSIAIEHRHLRPLIEHAVPFASSSDSRPILQGIRFEVKAGSAVARVASADGFVLLRTSVLLVAEAEHDMEFVVNAAVLKALRTKLHRASTRLAEFVLPASEPGEVRFVTRDQYDRLIDLHDIGISGQYPTYGALIPSPYRLSDERGFGNDSNWEQRVSVTLEAAELRRVAKAAIALDVPCLRFAVSDDGSALLMLSTQHEVGLEAAFTLTCTPSAVPSPERTPIAFNPSFIAAGLAGVLQSDRLATVTLSWMKTDEPAVLTMSTLPEAVWVQMPMFVEWPAKAPKLGGTFDYTGIA